MSRARRSWRYVRRLWREVDSIARSIAWECGTILIVVLKGRSANRLRLAFLFFAVIVVAAVLGLASNTPTSSAQTGYGAPQVLPDQTIQPASHSGSRTGLALGAVVGVAILGGATFYGWRRGHPHEHPYP
jgi:hypothetical protein